MANHEEFTNWLEHELAERGWNKAELARRANIDLSHLLRIMSGERNPGPNTGRAIARAFHLPAEEVFRHAGILPRSRKHPEGLEELQHYYKNLSEEDRERLLLFARALYEAHPSS